MSKLDYPFNFEKPRKKVNRSRNLRLTVIAIAIAAVTCGVIWVFLPPDSNTPKTELPKSSEESLNAVNKAIEEIGPSASELTTNDNTTAIPTDENNVIEEVTDNYENNSDSANIAQTLEPTSTEVEETSPKKGKPHPSDPTYDEPLVAPDAVDSELFNNVFANMQGLIDSQEYQKAGQLGESMLVKLTENSAQWRKVAKKLSQINLQIFLSGNQNGKKFYTVVSGDSLYRIAKTHGLSIEALRKMNKIPSDKDRLWIGEKLVVREANWHIVIEKRSRLLKLYNNKKLFAVYDIGIGRLGRTPVGEFKIADRIKDPVYKSEDGRTIAPGAPENELGRYFLKLFDGKNHSDGYGIHGTADESSVSKSLSNGCIRMRNAEIEELFSIVPNGTGVTIEE